MAAACFPFFLQRAIVQLLINVDRVSGGVARVTCPERSQRIAPPFDFARGGEPLGPEPFDPAHGPEIIEGLEAEGRSRRDSPLHTALWESGPFWERHKTLAKFRRRCTKVPTIRRPPVRGVIRSINNFTTEISGKTESFRRKGMCSTRGDNHGLACNLWKRANKLPCIRRRERNCLRKR